eukprot:TRINITY_DN31136_c0_g1_i9.p1 TRINITY_DN31136_c0_g1~~TRINITY_DN31136_c0_g1_i9.p1  ORF type:complete len:212 (+),score=49.81 TRINITY_DN31136_c0_g1_i9:861-1496(+)
MVEEAHVPKVAHEERHNPVHVDRHVDVCLVVQSVGIPTVQVVEEKEIPEVHFVEQQQDHVDAAPMSVAWADTELSSEEAGLVGEDFRAVKSKAALRRAKREAQSRWQQEDASRLKAQQVPEEGGVCSVVEELGLRLAALNKGEVDMTDESAAVEQLRCLHQLESEIRKHLDRQGAAALLSRVREGVQGLLQMSPGEAAAVQVGRRRHGRRR